MAKKPGAKSGGFTISVNPAFKQKVLENLKAKMLTALEKDLLFGSSVPPVGLFSPFGVKKSMAKKGSVVGQQTPDNCILEPNGSSSPLSQYLGVGKLFIGDTHLGKAVYLKDADNENKASMKHAIDTSVSSTLNGALDIPDITEEWTSMDSTEKLMLIEFRKMNQNLDLIRKTQADLLFEIRTMVKLWEKP